MTDCISYPAYEYQTPATSNGLVLSHKLDLTKDSPKSRHTFGFGDRTMNRIKILLAVNVCSALGFGLYSYLQPEPVADVAGLSTLAFEAAPTVKEKNDAENSSKADPNVKPEIKPVAAANDKQAVATPTFSLPFPDRVNIFQPPRRQGRLVVRTGDQTELSVELLGFVNVNGPRVALAIDGMAMTIAEGETRAGVKVLSIQPPAVILKRGRQRWQASFEN